MRIDVIDTDAGLAALRENWDQVFMADPHAQHFLSWNWLRDCLARRKRWFVLALREKAEGSPYVAFFPLRLLTEYEDKTATFHDEIIMAGNFAADYTGFIARPEYESNAIAGFSAYLKKQNWTSLRLDYFSGPAGRREAFVRAVQAPQVMSRDNAPKNRENIDNCICPYVSLPATWEDYLETRLSSQTRQKLKRFLRMVERDEAYRITFATQDTIGQYLDILFRLWRIRWAARKGEERTDRLIVLTREMLMDCFNSGTLEVPMLWHDDKPLGALANIIDRQKKAVLFYITGRDETWNTPSPGLILHATCIRRAIENGFASYDFLRGNEPYKYAFGVEERHVSCTIVRTRNGRNLGDVLHPRSIRYVYEKGTEFYNNGAKSRAEAAFRQVLACAPQHLGARFGLANLDFDRGSLVQAEAAYKEIAAVTQQPVPVLVRLGDAQLALRKYDEAADTFSGIVRDVPSHSQAHYKRGVALVAAKRTDEARKAFAALKTYHSDSPDHLAYIRKANDALARIAPVNASVKQTAKEKTSLSPVSEIVLAMTPSLKRGDLNSSVFIRRPT